MRKNRKVYRTDYTQLKMKINVTKVVRFASYYWADVLADTDRICWALK